MKKYETVQELNVLDDHRVFVVFDDGTKGVFDCKGYFSQPYWRKLANPEFFRSAYVEFGHLTWPGDIDISPIEVWEDAVRV